MRETLRKFSLPTPHITHACSASYRLYSIDTQLVQSIMAEWSFVRFLVSPIIHYIISPLNLSHLSQLSLDFH